MKCMRCKATFQVNHPLDAVCPTCLLANPDLSVEEKDAMNIWDKWADLASVVDLALARKWSWARNTECKYVDVRIDMRDGGCIIRVKGKRISPERLAWQYTKDTPEPPA